MLQRLFTAYAAGSIAALVASCALWVAGRAELIAALDVSIAPSLTWPWIARRLIWGGLWSALPIARLVPATSQALPKPSYTQKKYSVMMKQISL